MQPIQHHRRQWMWLPAWSLVAANHDQMQVWCTASSANFQAQLSLYEAEIAYSKLNERVQAGDATLTDEQHDAAVRSINTLYRDAFRHVTHALPRRLQLNSHVDHSVKQPSGRSVNVSFTHHTLRIDAYTIMLL